MTHDHAERLISVLEHIDAHLAALAEAAATSSVKSAHNASAVDLPEPSGDAQSPLSITRE